MSAPKTMKARAPASRKQSATARARSFLVRFFKDGHPVTLAGYTVDLRVPVVLVTVAFVAAGASYVVEHGLPSMLSPVPELEVAAGAAGGLPCPGQDVIKQFVGIDINTAVTLATANNLVLRIRQEDGLALSASEEVDTRRVNLDVENGKTVAAECG